MIIKVDNASKKIKNKWILRDINLMLMSGNIYGFKGVNGCGKTMLMRMISGLMKPSAGKIWVDGQQLGKEIDFPQRMGLFLENPAFLEDYTGIQNLRLLAEVRGYAADEDIENALVRVGLKPEDKRRYRKYSLGMKQKLGIAASIMEKPNLLILDEPMNALDQSGYNRVMNIIMEEKERGALILLACHDERILEGLADVIFVLADGCINEVLY